MKRPSWPEVVGPLEAYASDYRRELAALGYSRWAASAHMYLMAHVSRWLGEAGLEPAEVTSARVGEFLADRRACGHVRRLTPRGLVPLLGFLRTLGVVPEAAAPEPETPTERLVDAFATHLTDERGLAPTTIANYVRVARSFIVCFAPDPTVEGCGAERLGAVEINTFLLSECARRSVGSANRIVTALRALLRFFFLRGYTDAPLADCVPGGAAWRDTGRSRALEPADVKRLLTSCDRRTAIGRRDLAILTMLSRLGLRASEVASLSLDDIDWPAGTIAVTGKGRGPVLLPLPIDVGQAVADYCRRGRPRNERRALFLHARAPYTALTSSAVSGVVMRACERAGLPIVGAHRLRHSAASAMRQAGAPLFEIGQVLRHRWVVTTALYAKEDTAALASIARPWPGTSA